MPRPGNFFAVCLPVFQRACVLGMNAAVGLLVLARFSDRNNRTTAASAHAIETHTGISRGRAKTAISALIDNRLISRTHPGIKPRYEICVGGDADRVWLPNTLVTAAADEIPPLERLRQTQDPMTLRLLVDFYHAQNLREDGGIDRGAVWQEYERVSVGQCGQYQVWGFTLKNGFFRWGTPLTDCHLREGLKKERTVDFWRRLGQLCDLGLVEYVPHLFESSDKDGEPMHAYGLAGTDSTEDRLGTAANRAGASLLTSGQVAWATDKGLWLAPLPRHMANVQMIGIARLRYRPHTKLTAAWWAELNERGERFVQEYDAIYERKTRTRQAA